MSNEERNASAWWALVMGAAASIEDAANCVRDPDAKKQADGAAKHYREAAQKLMAAAGVPATAKCGPECDHICQQPDGWGGCAKRAADGALRDLSRLSEEMGEEL